MTLATTPDQSPLDDETLSLDDRKQQVKENWRLTRQKRIDERLQADLKSIDDLILRKLGDLDVAYQWIHDQPAYKPLRKVYDVSKLGPLNLKPGDSCRQFFLPEGHWVLLEEALMSVLEPRLKKLLKEQAEGRERMIQINNVLELAVSHCWCRCVIGSRQALTEREPSAYLQTRECWAEELVRQLQDLILFGDEETRIACVEPLLLMKTMLPARSELHCHISALNKAVEAGKADIRRFFELARQFPIE